MEIVYSKLNVGSGRYRSRFCNDWLMLSNGTNSTKLNKDALGGGTFGWTKDPTKVGTLNAAKIAKIWISQTKGEEVNNDC